MSVIGIDLGTTKCCVAIYQNDKVEVIANERGNRTTPNYVAFTKSQRLIGDAAKTQVANNPTNTVLDAKRLIGRRFNDPTVQADIKHWPFYIVNDNGKPKIEVEYKGETRRFDAEEISSMVLTKMKETAEAYLGEAVTKAVVTIPAYFNDSQRQATRDAGQIAGLDIYRIVDDSSAVAIAYGFGRKEILERNVLIFDLGGGTFSVSVVTISDGCYEFKSTSGDSHLGGEDFDSRLVEYFCKEFEKKHCKDLTSNKKALRRLRNECECVKRTLSSSFEETIEIDQLFEGIDFKSKITRARFEELNIDLFLKVLKHVEDVIKEAEMDKSELHDVVLVGGSSRIPKVQKLLEDFFDGKKLNYNVDPDEALVYGAALKAAMFVGDLPSLEYRMTTLLPIVPLSLGIETEGGAMEVLIKRNSSIVVEGVKEFTTYSDNQESILIQVFEGESLVAKDNNLLGNFGVHGIPPAPKGVPLIEVKFVVDFDGILDIGASDDTFRIVRILPTIKTDKGRYSTEEIRRRIEDAGKLKDDDLKYKAKAEAKYALEAYAFDIKSAVEDGGFKVVISNADERKLMKVADNTLKWLESNPNASMEEIENEQKEMEDVWDPIVIKVFGSASGPRGFRQGGVLSLHAKPVKNSEKPEDEEQD